MRIKREFLNTLFKLPIGLKRILAGPIREHNGIHLDLNTQIVCRLDNIGQLIAPKTAALENIEDARNFMAMGINLFAPYKKEESVKLEDIQIYTNQYCLDATIYTPENTKNGTILYFHGGGWVLGSHHTHDSICRGLAAKAHAQIISVNYRLAPEYPYPSANEDALAAYRNILSRYEELKLVSNQIFVSGDSAGGYLATYVALMAEQVKLPRPLGQILFYPVTDVSGKRDRSKYIFSNGNLLTSHQMQRFETLFFRHELQKSEKIFSPLCSPNLALAPPTLIVTAGFDVLCDEGVEYANKLHDLGIYVVHKNISDQVHGFLSIQLACQPAFDETAAIVKSFIENL